MYYLPQEIEAWYIIPALRRDIATYLVRDYGISYDKIGKLLGISKAAVSQYLKGKRAAKIKLPKEIEQQIIKSCKLMVKDKSCSTEEITKILKFIRDKGLKCEVRGELKEGLSKDCREIKYDNGNYVAANYSRVHHSKF